GDAGDADANRLAGVRQQAGEQLLRRRLVPRAARLDQRQGTGQHSDVAGPHAGVVLVQRQLAPAGSRHETRFGRRHRITIESGPLPSCQPAMPSAEDSNSSTTVLLTLMVLGT